MREYLAEFGGDCGPLLWYRRKIDLGDFADVAWSGPGREHGCGAGQQSSLSEAIVKSEAHCFLFDRPMVLYGDQDAGAQNEKSLGDAALLDKNIPGFVGSPLQLRGKMALLLRERSGRPEGDRAVAAAYP